MQYKPYEFWERALAGEEVGGPTLPIHDGQPEPGFYRRKQKDKTFTPIAIFEHETEMVALIRGRVEDPNPHWTYCCRYPISEEAYYHALETGQWPDVDEAVSASIETDETDGDDTASLRLQIDKAAASLGGYVTIKDDPMAARAQSLRSRLLELSRQADKNRKAEKQPHLDRSKLVDAKWMPLVKEASDGANMIARALSVYATEQAKQHVEERRNEPEPTQIRGGYGRAASIKTVKVIARISDLAALVAWALETNPTRMTEVLCDLAESAVNRGQEVPGVIVEEQRKVV